MASRNDLDESESQMIVRYIGGLKNWIQDKVPLHTIFDLANAIDMQHVSRPHEIVLKKVIKDVSLSFDLECYKKSCCHSLQISMMEV